MTDTDRIAQMAREAGAGTVCDTDPQCFIGDTAFDADALQAFARLVAEDCAKVCDDKASKVYDHAKAPYLNMSQAIRASYSKE